MRIAITLGPFGKEIVMYAGKSGFTLLYYMIYTFANYCYLILGAPSLGLLLDDNDTWIKEKRVGYKNPRYPWRELIKEVITAGSLLHAINNDSRTILENIISVYTDHFKLLKCLKVIL
jgi:hypothetical protein